MEWKSLFDIALTAAGVGVMLYISSVREQLRQVREENTREHTTMRHDIKNNAQVLSNLREMIPSKYATIDDLNRSVDQGNQRITDVFNVLSRMESKMDRMQENGKGS